MISLSRQIIFAVVAGGVAGVLSESGFGGIALSIFISLLVCGLLVLCSEFFKLRSEIIEFSQNTVNNMNSMGKGITETFTSQEQAHHKDIQDLYNVLAKLMNKEN